MGLRGGVIVDVRQFCELAVACKYYEWFNRAWTCNFWRRTRGSN